MEFIHPCSGYVYAQCGGHYFIEGNLSGRNVRVTDHGHETNFWIPNGGSVPEEFYLLVRGHSGWNNRNKVNWIKEGF